MNHYSNHPIIKMAISAILIITCTNCMQHQKAKYQGKQINGIRLSVKIQLVSTENFSLSTFEDSMEIYYYNNLVLYQFNHPYDIRKVTFDTSGNFMHENIIQEGIRNSYFIYQKGDLYGFRYDSITAQTSHRFLVDSFLNKKLSHREETFDVSDDSLVDAKKVHGSYDLFEKYIPKIKLDETYPDSSYYYYNRKMNGIDYSFSKTLDQEKNMKLCRIIFVYNPLRSKKYTQELPRREVRLAIEELPVANSKEILAFFERHLKADN
jgi:hypothetical protein